MYGKYKIRKVAPKLEDYKKYSEYKHAFSKVYKFYTQQKTTDSGYIFYLIQELDRNYLTHQHLDIEIIKHKGAIIHIKSKRKYEAYEHGQSIYNKSETFYEESINSNEPLVDIEAEWDKELAWDELMNISRLYGIKTDHINEILEEWVGNNGKLSTTNRKRLERMRKKVGNYEPNNTI